MSKTGLTEKEFFQQMLRFAESKNINTAKKWYDAFVEVVIRNIYLTGNCLIPKLGNFTVRKMEETVQTHPTPSGKTVTYVVPARVVPVFNPNDGFINDVNMTGVTKAYRKRLKNNALTARDYDRLMFAQKFEQEGRQVITEERKAEIQQRFAEILAQKKKEAQKRANKEKQKKIEEENVNYEN